MATWLLCLSEWEEVPERGWMARMGMRAQNMAARAAAVLVGGREGDGTDGVALPAVCHVSPRRSRQCIL